MPRYQLRAEQFWKLWICNWLMAGAYFDNMVGI